MPPLTCGLRWVAWFLPMSGWYRIAQVMRRPVTYAVVIVVALLTLAAPFLKISWGGTARGSGPSHLSRSPRRGRLTGPAPCGSPAYGQLPVPVLPPPGRRAVLGNTP